MFDFMLNDPGFKYRNRFTTLESMGGDCVPLQTADFFAYEDFKESQRLTLQPRDRRRSLDVVLERGLMGGRLRGFDRPTLRLLKKRIDEMPLTIRQTLFSIARIPRSRSAKKKSPNGEVNANARFVLATSEHRFSEPLLTTKY